jgi:hypothetical protein
MKQPKRPTKRAPATASARPAQRTQAEVHYRRGTPIQMCAVCVMYWHRDTHKIFGGCTAVTGNITAYGRCDLFHNLKNPFGSVLDANEQQELENWFQQAAATKAQPGNF